LKGLFLPALLAHFLTFRKVVTFTPPPLDAF
jgi:hypothetical protein